jgi:hypothetical protein
VGASFVAVVCGYQLPAELVCSLSAVVTRLYERQLHGNWKEHVGRIISARNPKNILKYKL